ncbi:MAG: hypothetical protein GX681_08975, partial [Clostridiaceae bacterium]|nr:hypothetical protein [Clostridiaceae bacterium]
MKTKLLTDIKYESARDLLLTKVRSVLSEEVALTECYGRILAQDLYARENSPPFDKSAYDGYAFRAAGDLLAKSGSVIDPGTAGSLAAQGVSKPEVYKIPSVGLISTGNEIIDPDDNTQKGKIRNSNRYMLAAALSKLGMASRYLGRAG